MRKLIIPLLFCVLAFNPLFSRAASDGEGGKGTLYVPLNPPFVVNIHDGRQLRFMQVQVQVLARDKRAMKVVEHHMPAVRDALISLLSEQRLGQVSRPGGREKVRHQALAAVQNVLKANAGVSKAVGALYFTDFVVQ
jgi:flagellar FliL protein